MFIYYFFERRCHPVLREFRDRRKRLQAYTSVSLPLVLLGGWFYPFLGFFILLCMVGAVGLASLRGRAWCDWMCPRGSFYDLFLKKFSKNVAIPAFMRTNAFRSGVLVLLAVALGTQLYFTWGDPRRMGMAFMRVLTVTTTAGIVLGAVFQQRAWCHICPMGTLGKWLSRYSGYSLHVSELCRDCKLCARVCPMQLKPYEGKAGVMAEGDCIKCATCAAACPVNALEFKREQKRAA